MTDTILTEAERALLRALVDREGEFVAAQRCALSRATLQRALAGSTTRRNNIAAIRRVLAETEVDK